MTTSRTTTFSAGATLIAFATALLAPPVYAQTMQSTIQCVDGSLHVEGTVVDPSGNLIVGASVLSADGQTATTDAKGHFTLDCVSKTSNTLSVDATGFASTQALAESKDGKPIHLLIKMPIAQVNTDISVGNDDNPSGLDASNGAGTHTLRGKDIQDLADDPDDFKRELQVLAAASGGVPGAATITVDGFQNSSAMPPKSSIARIVTAPDMFSSEYQEPPYAGGRVEIYTKPGADGIHGALFYTDSDGSFNANDPFSTVATPAGKRRYGFELSGPIVKKKSDYSLALEKRDIDEFNVVNAITLDAAGNQNSLHQTVSAPQRLWIASARSDLQATPSDVFTLSFAANVSNLGNQGVGGLTLPEAGYDSYVSEYDLRATNTQTISPNLLQETHIGWTWKDSAQTPLSTAPSLNVSGYFNGGGNPSQFLNDRERNLEIDDDFLYTHGKHSWKIGAQSLGIFVHNSDPATFNGAFTFGGGNAPVLDTNNIATGTTAGISPLEQYRRAILNLPGGTPTTYQVTTGTALVPYAQWRLALYAQDNIKLSSRVSLSAGFRYQIQTTPNTYANFAPRVGLAWAVDKHSKTVIHARAGIFAQPVTQGLMLDAFRLNGSRQLEQNIYNPSFTDPLSAAPGSVAISTTRLFPNTFRQLAAEQSMIGIEHDFPHHWHAQGNFFNIQVWNDYRSRNINAPFLAPSVGTVPDPVAATQGQRPLGPGKNILQYQQTGHLVGKVIFLGLDQHSYKRFGFFAGYLYFNFSGDTVQDAGFVQNTYSNQGETARPDWLATQRFFAFGNYNLPYKASLSVEADAQSGQPYTFTTGTDSNGDGNFNDRPSYASAPGTGVYSTRFGLLTDNTVNGDVPRNLGTMPSLVHIDVNLSRAWKLGSKNTARTLTLNARSANILNHTNVTAVGSVVSSPNFTQSVAAEAARRLELGVRFQF